MARYRNTVNGVVVSMDDDAPMLPGSWEPYEEDQETRKATPRKRTSSRRKAETGATEPAETDDE